MDRLCLKAGSSPAISPSPMGVAGGLDFRSPPAQVSALGRTGAGAGAPATVSSSTSSSRYVQGGLRHIRSLWPGTHRRSDQCLLESEAEAEAEEAEPPPGAEGQKRSWVLKILDVTSMWAETRRSPAEEGGGEGESDGGRLPSPDDEGELEACAVDADDEEELDREGFSRLLRRASLMEAKIYAQMSYLGSLAYSIPKIKPGNLFKYQGLRFVTSSLDKKAQLAAAEKEQNSSLPKLESIVSEENQLPSPETDSVEKRSNSGYRVSASAAYKIAASAASYLQSHTRNILSFRSSKARMEDLEVEVSDSGESEIASSEVASFVATTNSVTAVVAGKEEMKQAVAKDLSSARSSPCEWFICDDDRCGTRFFVIQGSESLASWQANLLFEPVQFEGLDVLVHRGIYEAAKGIYEQILPEVRAHLKLHGNSATLRFTGHSLGGSLSLLVNLMLLVRGEAPLSSLLPVVTFGSPSIMCGGDHLLHKLGLPPNHVQAIMMHRDIVPRAFSCKYPDHVAELLRAVSGSFRKHPCLQNQKLLYAPMGKLLILQPEENFSPHHDLLPSGCGLYLLGNPRLDSDDLVKKIQRAQHVFLNSPHPLDILSDRSAYGSDGTIYRDHDMNSYLRTLHAVIRRELKNMRRVKREQRRKAWWPLVVSRELVNGITVGQHTERASIGLCQPSFSGAFRSGRESLKRFSRLVASQHVQLLVVLLFPARLLLLGTFAITNFR